MERLLIAVLTVQAVALGALTTDGRSDDYSPRLGDARNFTAMNGRLDVKIAGQWRALCGTINRGTARVACREMGLPSNFPRILPSLEYPSENVPNTTVRISCRGEESRLAECRIRPQSAVCEEISAIVCSDDPGYKVRLVGGDNSTGRLEVKIAGIWGTVCNRSFHERDAKSVCRILGLGTAVPLAWPIREFGQADSGQIIWFNAVDCLTGLSHDCSHIADHKGTCSHDADVIVSCKSLEDLYIPIRLAGGPDNTTGRLEVFFDGQWGTVCRNSFDSKSAQVACRQMDLPYEGADITTDVTLKGAATGPVFLDNVRCMGEESHVIQCPHDSIGTTECDHSEDVIIQCRDNLAPTVGVAIGIVAAVLVILLLLIVGGYCVKKKYDRRTAGRYETTPTAGATQLYTK